MHTSSGGYFEVHGGNNQFTQEYAIATEDVRINIQKLNFYLYEAWKLSSICWRIACAQSIRSQAQAA